MAISPVSSTIRAWYSPNVGRSGAHGNNMPALTQKSGIAPPPNTEAPQFVAPPKTSRPQFVITPLTYRPEFIPEPSVYRPSFVPAAPPIAAYSPSPPARGQGFIPGSNTVFDGERETSPPESADSATRPGAYAGCQTCQNRRYVDGSGEGNVSFKSPGHIAPEASAAVVMSHEREHVSNAYQEADRSGGKVLSASVQLRSSICPECHRSYISGGTTRTVVSTPVQAYKPWNSGIGGTIDIAS